MLQNVVSQPHYGDPHPLNPTSSPPAESQRALERPERPLRQAVPLGPQVHLHQVPPVLHRPGEWVKAAEVPRYQSRFVPRFEYVTGFDSGGMLFLKT